MTLNISLSPEQQAELKTLVEAQQDTSLSEYHKWLTQKEFGSRFGLTEADLSRIGHWLAMQGFTVRAVSKSRNAITFAGRASQVEAAFGIELHRYQLDGEFHFANANELRVPAELAGVLTEVRGLNDFRPSPHARVLVRPLPKFSASSGYHFLAPGDWELSTMSRPSMTPVILAPGHM